MGAFQQLLEEAKAMGCLSMQFNVALERSDEDMGKWLCSSFGPKRTVGKGRAGEEALRDWLKQMKEKCDALQV